MKIKGSYWGITNFNQNKYITGSSRQQKVKEVYRL